MTFLLLHQVVWKSRTKCFRCCNLFPLYILRFSHPQKYILALDKIELLTTRVHRKYYLVKAARQSYPRWPRKRPRKHNSLKPWFVIGRNNFFTSNELVSPLWLVEVKSKTLFHTAKFHAKNLSIYKKTSFHSSTALHTRSLFMTKNWKIKHTPWATSIKAWLS